MARWSPDCQHPVGKIDYQDIIVNKRDGIEILTINHPSRYNSLTYDTLRELKEALLRAEKDDNIEADWHLKVEMIFMTGYMLMGGDSQTN